MVLASWTACGAVTALDDAGGSVAKSECMPHCSPTHARHYPSTTSNDTTIHHVTLLFSYCSVWGGGIFLPDVFYDTADELGG